MEFTGRAVLPFFGQFYSRDISEELCKQYIKERRTKGRQDGTILTELTHLRTTLTWAKKRGMIPEAPDVFRPRQPPPKTDYLTKAQARLFLQAIDVPHIRLFVVLALCTGARSSAILELTWDRVDLQRGQIDFKTDQAFKKNRSVVPLNKTALDILAEQEPHKDTDYVVSYGGRRVMSVKKGIRSVAQKTNLGFVTPHVFRHSAAVWMAEAGISMEEISQFLGHSGTEITRKVYARYSPTYLKKASDALDLNQ